VYGFDHVFGYISKMPLLIDDTDKKIQAGLIRIPDQDGFS